MSATTLRDNVESLYLDGTAITDAAVDGLLEWKRLKSIGLSKTSITSTGLLRLADHPSLLQIRVEPDRTTELDRETIVRKKGKSFLSDSLDDQSGLLI